VSVAYFGPPGFKSLLERAGIDCFHRAVHITLDGPTHSDTTVEHLCRLPRLRSITLNRTRVSPSGLARLGLALPDCKIIHGAGPSSPFALVAAASP